MACRSVWLAVVTTAGASPHSIVTAPNRKPRLGEFRVAAEQAKPELCRRGRGGTQCLIDLAQGRELIGWQHVGLGEAQRVEAGRAATLYAGGLASISSALLEHAATSPSQGPTSPRKDAARASARDRPAPAGDQPAGLQRGQGVHYALGAEVADVIIGHGDNVDADRSSSSRTTVDTSRRMLEQGGGGVSRAGQTNSALAKTNRHSRSTQAAGVKATGRPRLARMTSPTPTTRIANLPFADTGNLRTCEAFTWPPGTGPRNAGWQYEETSRPAGRGNRAPECQRNTAAVSS